MSESDPNQLAEEDRPAEIGDPAETPDRSEPSPFRHPPWMVGVVVIFGVMAFLGGFENPLWWLMGAPFILALAVYLWVRLWSRG